MNVGNYVPLPAGGRRWVGREWLDEALALQRKGMTLSEIAELLDISRAAVVKALYSDVVERVRP